ncbi:PREDICTED: E3 ubiquitin-protein ligase RNF180 [Nanorana parkeri]|uniref:E3 ubiquitin-protein ligase RNF180 n=1 Tax=Nanorana parkeri TaxID=125878 RepID=UPI0008540FDF|nr:PREDICTED: E3 ubiquitin-protein ligase RNF180 [Nanorana parkeri]
MSHKSNVFLLRCWKCRKCVANSECLVRDGECGHCQKDVDSSIYQGACNIWHVEAEESPDWIKREIEKINISNLRTDEEEDIPEKESYTCAVCLDVYFNPYMCYPCRHVFCEPCLRMLARDNPSKTPCPLCRTIIAIVRFQTDLSKSSAALFPNEYLKRRQSFQRTSSAKWPLPSCNRLFRVFGDLRRHMDRIGRRQFPHAGYRFDFEDESHGWRFNLDMIIIYFYSMNWVIGFIVFCLLCYYFFLSV